MATRRKGAIRRADIPKSVIKELEAGTDETVTLVELLAIDFRKLLHTVAPKAAAHADQLDPTVGIVQRMNRAGRILWDVYGARGLKQFERHSSDTVRGWVAFAHSARPRVSLEDRLTRIRPLADDPHSGVREWAWLALRPYLAESIEEAVVLLTPWTADSSPFVRRFATESTRPRGVWCGHIDLLKERPQLGLDLLEPLRSDPEKYVQDSVSNWLNDASKSQPAWVERLCARWRRESKSAATERICRRALRSSPKT